MFLLGYDTNRYQSLNRKVHPKLEEFKQNNLVVNLDVCSFKNFNSKSLDRKDNLCNRNNRNDLNRTDSDQDEFSQDEASRNDSNQTDQNDFNQTDDVNQKDTIQKGTLTDKKL